MNLKPKPLKLQSINMILFLKGKKQSVIKVYTIFKTFIILINTYFKKAHNNYRGNKNSNDNIIHFLRNFCQTV